MKNLERNGVCGGGGDDDDDGGHLGLLYLNRRLGKDGPRNRNTFEMVQQRVFFHCVCGARYASRI